MCNVTSMRVEACTTSTEIQSGAEDVGQHLAAPQRLRSTHLKVFMSVAYSEQRVIAFVGAIKCT